MFEEMTGNAADAALAQGSSLPKSMSEGETGAAGRLAVTAIGDSLMPPLATLRFFS